MRPGVLRRRSMKWTLLLLIAALLTGCKTNVTPEQQVHDAQAAAQVKAALAKALGVSTVMNVSVNVTNGIATLSGQVDTAARKTRAEEIARGVPKVSRVVNNLQVGG
jgi:osmotically-inducible protein OsmY